MISHEIRVWKSLVNVKNSLNIRISHHGGETEDFPVK